MHSIWLLLIGFLASVTGTWISWRIWKSKQPAIKESASKNDLMCPREMPCDIVVNSAYSKTFGIGNDILGIVYFAGEAVLFVIYAFSLNHILFIALSLIVAVGLLFSFYLIIIQAFVLKKWCLWCLGSTAANIIIGLSVYMLWYY